MESAIWCRTPTAASAARRWRPDVWKNSSTALSSNDGELARSITACAPVTASLTPSPVMVLTPLLGEAAMTSWPPRRRMTVVFEPISPVPPMITIFMIYPPLSMTGSNEARTTPASKLHVLSKRKGKEGFVPSLPLDPMARSPLQPGSGRGPFGIGEPGSKNVMPERIMEFASYQAMTGLAVAVGHNCAPIALLTRSVNPRDWKFARQHRNTGDGIMPSTVRLH